MPKHTYRNSDYLDGLVRVHSLRASISDALDILDTANFDTFAFRGISGALITPTLALLMDKELCAVRKPKTDENSHGFFNVEGNRGAQRFVIVDDFISTGATVLAILKEMAEFAPSAVCVGFYSVRDQKFATLSEWLAEKSTFYLFMPDSKVKYTNYL
jgi:adenine/guanine phosphoribosyltransferase-like PRPP-binding protein